MIGILLRDCHPCQFPTNTILTSFGATMIPGFSEESCGREGCHSILGI